MIKILFAALTFLISFLSYCSMKTTNEVTGQKQYVAMNHKEEIALGLKSLPSMEKQYGKLDTDAQAEEYVEKIGRTVIQTPIITKTPYKFDFHVISSDKTINAFALPGGQVFITSGLLKRLKTDGQLAGVLGHEVAHVVARHGSQQLAKQKLTQGILTATDIAVYNPEKPNKSQVSTVMTRVIGSLVTMRFGRKDELEADNLGLTFMAKAGYSPVAMIDVMHILEQATKSGLNPEFFSTHPNPTNRIKKIEEAIKEMYPDGVPKGLLY